MKKQEGATVARVTYHKRHIIKLLLKDDEIDVLLSHDSSR
jgi:hypothetical protein